MDDQALLRYSRHILLPQIGIEGQQRLIDARVLIVGAGGLGSPVALYLAAAGVGCLTLMDHDRVDLTNLQRQIAHSTDRVGQPKAESAAQAMRALNPLVNVQPLCERADASKLAAQVSAHSLVIDCTDNFSTRQAINAACMQAGVPLVSGSAVGVDGQVSVYDPRHADSPCYACLFPPDAAVPEVACATMGVLSPLVGLVGSLQAEQAMECIVAGRASLQGRLAMIQTWPLQWHQIGVQRDPACPVCASRPQTSG